MLHKALTLMPALLLLTLSGCADMDESTTSTEDWGEDVGLYLVAGTTLYMDELDFATDDMDRGRYSAAEDHLLNADSYAQVMLDYFSCSHPDAEYDCSQVRDYVSEFQYAAEMGWRCMIDLQLGYDSGDCDRAIAAMEYVDTIYDDYLDRIERWSS